MTANDTSPAAGLPGERIEPNGSSRVFGSVDLGGTNLDVALASGDGEIIATGSEPTRSNQGPEQVISRMADALHRLQAEAGVECNAIAVGCPGWVDVDAGVTRYLPNLTGGWRDVPIAEILGRALGGIGVYLLNDVRMATLGEWTYGHGRDDRDMALFAIGTGVGGGLVLDGKLRLGEYGSAGEFGHQIMVAGGRRCGCGSRGCLEAYASGPALRGEGVRLMSSGQAPRLFELAGGDASRVDSALMAQAADQGDEAVAASLDDAIAMIGTAVCNVIVTCHPELIVLTGGVAGLGDRLFDGVRQAVNQQVQVFSPDGVEIVGSLLGGRAGVLGGIALARSGGLRP